VYVERSAVVGGQRHNRTHWSKTGVLNQMSVEIANALSWSPYTEPEELIFRMKHQTCDRCGIMISVSMWGTKL
jgi:hypothetical protein